MSKSNILLKITGSIAAYKIGYLISKFIQNSYEVQTVTTESALKFIGSALLEGLTGKPVFTNMFESGRMMDHINLVKWADLTLLAPATANTINKMSAGISDNLVTTLFLAHDREKPYLIAPAMNTKMLNHPSTQHSLSVLKELGVEILPTETGFLACGDTGSGKMLDPDVIYERVYKKLKKRDFDKNDERLSVLITSGGTRENIDGIRFISNLSTGNTGATIADHFIHQGHKVTYLHADSANLPSGNCKMVPFTDFTELNDTLKNLLNQHNYHSVIHLAAVSDFSVDAIEIKGKKVKSPLSEKIPSDIDQVSLQLTRNIKIINRIRDYASTDNFTLIAFKCTRSQSDQSRSIGKIPTCRGRIGAVEQLFNRSGADFVVLNDVSDRTQNLQQHFRIFDPKQEFIEVETASELARILEELIIKS